MIPLRVNSNDKFPVLKREYTAKLNRAEMAVANMDAIRVDFPKYDLLNGLFRKL